MKKVQRLLSMTDGEKRKHVLDYTHVDLHYVEDQKKNLLRNIVRALGGRGKRKDEISPKEVVFTKAYESPSKTAPEITFDSESECDNQEPLPPLPKLSGAEPISTSNDTKSPSIPDPCPEKKADSSNEQLLLTLMEEKKSDAADCIMSFIRKMENLNEVRVKELRSDNGTEFRN
ncbi:hypothetical protein Tco_0591395 [Tanacetum coccineum]